MAVEMESKCELVKEMQKQMKMGLGDQDGGEIGRGKYKEVAKKYASLKGVLEKKSKENEKLRLELEEFQFLKLN